MLLSLGSLPCLPSSLFYTHLLIEQSQWVQILMLACLSSLTWGRFVRAGLMAHLQPSLSPAPQHGYWHISGNGAEAELHKSMN